VAAAAEKFELAIRDCSVHGTGEYDCICEKVAYEYDYALISLRSSDYEALEGGHWKKRKRRKEYRPIHAAPHFAKPKLAELADKMYARALRLDHTPEVIWDDECCAAMYCGDCRRWGHTMFDYLGDPVGEEVEGELFEKECGV
jgi:hypothetical protein